MSHTHLSVHPKSCLDLSSPSESSVLSLGLCSPPRFLVTSSPPGSGPTEYFASHVAGSYIVHSLPGHLCSFSPLWPTVSGTHLATPDPLVRAPMLASPMEHGVAHQEGSGCVVGCLACSEESLVGSLQARLGSQGDAQAMQAVRTARGNSFCVDCDAPSKRHRTGGSHLGGEGAPATPGTPSLSPKRPALCVCPVFFYSGPAPWGWVQTTLPHWAAWGPGPQWAVLASPCPPLPGTLNWGGLWWGVACK